MALKILVTGADGFIGKHLYDKLESLGYDVYGVDCNLTSQPTNNPKIYHYDLSTSKIHDKFDVIFHLAALARIPLSIKNPTKYITNNVQSTLNVLEYCRETGARLIFTSSSTVGDVSDYNPYTNSKRICEQLCKMYSLQYGVFSTILRYFNVYGDGMATGEYATAIQKFMEVEEIEINGTGNQKRLFTHVEDIVNATIITMIDGLQGIYDVYNKHDLFSINDLADMYNKPTKHNLNKSGGSVIQFTNFDLPPNFSPKHNLKSWLTLKLQS